MTAGNWSGLRDNLRHASRTDKKTWPFDDPPNVVAFTTKSIVFGRQPVLLESHNEGDGAWQFLPREGAGHVKNAALVGLREMIERDARSPSSRTYPWAGAHGENLQNRPGCAAVEERKLGQMTAVARRWRVIRGQIYARNAGLLAPPFSGA